jgi:pimeloyl-ACP methyl ester carboxylesterase
MNQAQVAMNLREEGDELLILLHGLGCAKESFDGAFTSPHLTGYAICVFDFPGHGRSARTQNHTLETYAEITSTLIKTLQGNYRRVHLAGHSMGGAVALLTPDTVDTLISIDGNLTRQSCGLISRDTAEQSLDDFISVGYPDFLRKLKESDEPDLTVWYQWASQVVPEVMHSIARSLVRWSDSGDLLDLLDLRHGDFIYGDRDDRNHALQGIKGRVVAVPDAGHFMMVDNPDGFYQAIADLIS